MPDQRAALRNIRTFPQLIKFSATKMDWPIESDDFRGADLRLHARGTWISDTASAR